MSQSTTVDALPANEEPTPPAARPAGRSARKPFLILGAVTLAVLASVGGYAAYTANRENTDDATVESDVVPVSARVGSLVLTVRVTDNQIVKQGDVLVELDERDLSARVKQAEAGVATAKAQAAAADAQVTVAEATAKGGLTSAKAGVYGSAELVTSASAQIAAAEAGLKRAQADAKKSDLDLARVRQLVEGGSVPQQRLDDAVAANEAAQAAVEQAEAEVAAAKQSKRVAQSRVTEARGRLDQSEPIDSRIAVAKADAELAHAREKSAEAELELARLQRSYAKITAPGDGVVSRVSVHTGQLVQPGQPVAQFVPGTSYVVANFKETQVGRMKPGDQAEIAIDAYPGRTFSGTVESLSAATGSRFALMPPDNASGNFVKVVQRVPVRIEWHAPPDRAMRAGLSADVTVFVR
ncbi:MAG: HlyD family secretion protein [Sorangiineae bacterium]|nr:HlyD family secretion protein [Polyangiaceae bacterium]MEB2321877.1 HlyD family secretion protein [Sorangiineae bacterium]